MTQRPPSRVLREAEAVLADAALRDADELLARALVQQVVSGWLLGLALGLWAASWLWEPRR